MEKPEYVSDPRKQKMHEQLRGMFSSMWKKKREKKKLRHMSRSSTTSTVSNMSVTSSGSNSTDDEDFDEATGEDNCIRRRRIYDSIEDLKARRVVSKVIENLYVDMGMKSPYTDQTEKKESTEKCENNKVAVVNDKGATLARGTASKTEEINETHDHSYDNQNPSSIQLGEGTLNDCQTMSNPELPSEDLYETMSMPNETKTAASATCKITALHVATTAGLPDTPPPIPERRALKKHLTPGKDIKSVDGTQRSKPEPELNHDKGVYETINPGCEIMASLTSPPTVPHQLSGTGSKLSLPASTREEFATYSVDQLVECFNYCGLGDLAEVCGKEMIDGDYFLTYITDKQLAEDPFFLSQFRISKVRHVINGFRPKVADGSTK